MIISAGMYFALTLIAALSAVAAALRSPLHRRGAAVWFALGFPAFHFPGTLLSIGAIVTLLAGFQGLFQSGVGLLSLLPAAIGAYALLAVKVRSHATGATFERALEQTLGADFRKDASRQLHNPVSRNPFRLRRPGVTVSSDVSYGDAGIRNLLDVYRAAPAVRRAAPVFLWLHGGAWVMGHKKQQGMPLLYTLAQRGWLCVSMNYQLGPVSRFPASLIDVKRAIAWVQRHAPTYGGDPSFIIVSGGSAGAHLAALAALTPNQPEYQPGFEAVDTALAGAVPLYGRFDFIDRSDVVRHKDFLMDFLGTKVMPGLYTDDPRSWDLASPIALVGARAPPMLVAHGTHDSLIPIGEAAAFVAALRAISAQPVVFASLDGAQHAWDLFNTPWTRHTVSAVHAFCEHLYDKRQPRA
ncbi:MAG: alpha/beta hydrolase [Steroidobacteraceae bacterium]